MRNNNFLTDEEKKMMLANTSSSFSLLSFEGPYNFFPANEEDKDLLIWRYGNKFKTSVEFRHFIHDTELKGKSARAINNDPFLKALKHIDYDMCTHRVRGESCIKVDKRGRNYCSLCGMYFKKPRHRKLDMMINTMTAINTMADYETEDE